MYFEVIIFENMSYPISISTAYIKLHASCERMCIDSQQIKFGSLQKISLKYQECRMMRFLN